MTANPTHAKNLIVTRPHLVRIGGLIARISEDLWEDLMPGKYDAKKVPDATGFSHRPCENLFD